MAVSGGGCRTVAGEPGELVGAVPVAGADRRDHVDVRVRPAPGAGDRATGCGDGEQEPHDAAPDDGPQKQSLPVLVW